MNTNNELIIDCVNIEETPSNYALLPCEDTFGDSTYNADLTLRRAGACSIMAVQTGLAVAAGMIPTSFSDSFLLGPIQLMEIKAISRCYGIDKDENIKRIVSNLFEIGGIDAIGKTFVNSLKAIPGINISASVIDGVIAGAITAALGVGSIYVFEQIYLGYKTTEDLDWIKKVIEGKLTLNLIERIKPMSAKLSDSAETKVNVKALSDLVMSLFGVRTDADMAAACGNA